MKATLLPVLLILVYSTAVNSCGTAEEHAPGEPEAIIETAADTVAMKMVNAIGGLSAWSEIPYLRFDFSVDTENGQRSHRRHFWDMDTGQYRLEYTMGEDTLVTVLFNTDSKVGSAFINGEPSLQVDSDRLVARGHRSFINDTYWLLAPLKVFDSGVSRGMGEAADSEHSMLTLDFDSVGYTPGDRYWLSVSDETGRLDTWTFLLQGRDQPSTFSWVDYQSYETSGGVMNLSNRKTSESVAINTDNISFPAAVDGSMFTEGGRLLD